VPAGGKAPAKRLNPGLPPPADLSSLFRSRRPGRRPLAPDLAAGGRRGDL